jgi:hypothetical protein
MTFVNIWIFEAVERRVSVHIIHVLFALVSVMDALCFSLVGVRILYQAIVWLDGLLWWRSLLYCFFLVSICNTTVSSRLILRSQQSAKAKFSSECSLVHNHVLSDIFGSRNA